MIGLAHLNLPEKEPRPQRSIANTGRHLYLPSRREQLRKVLGLSRREAWVTKAVFDDRVRPAIAMELGVSVRIVHTYLKWLFRKLDATSRLDVVCTVVAAGHRLSEAEQRRNSRRSERTDGTQLGDTRMGDLGEECSAINHKGSEVNRHFWGDPVVRRVGLQTALSYVYGFVVDVFLAGDRALPSDSDVVRLRVCLDCGDSRTHRGSGSAEPKRPICLLYPLF